MGPVIESEPGFYTSPIFEYSRVYRASRLCLISGRSTLKVVSNEKEGGQEVVSINRYWSKTVALGIFSSSLDSAVVFKLAYFCFR